MYVPSFGAGIVNSWHANAVLVLYTDASVADAAAESAKKQNNFLIIFFRPLFVSGTTFKFYILFVGRML